MSLSPTHLSDGKQLRCHLNSEKYKHLDSSRSVFKLLLFKKKKKKTKKKLIRDHYHLFLFIKKKCSRNNVNERKLNEKCSSLFLIINYQRGEICIQFLVFGSNT